MKKWLILIVIILTVVLGAITYHSAQGPKPEKSSERKAEKVLKVTSPAFNGGELIPRKYTCQGENVNPPLAIENIPNEIKSLVLMMDDPDAPVGTFTHWLVWNIDPQTRNFLENTTPNGGVSGTNSAGKNGYTGPCPPFGTHRYIFKIFALDNILNLPPGAKRSQLETAMENHLLGSGQLMAKYSKK